jgi:hypothetical protein
MTCLIAPPSFHADNNGAGPRQELLNRLAQSYQALLNQWREQGLNPELFLSTPQSLARLSEWSQPQLLELQQALVGLRCHPQACAAMADVLEQIGHGTTAPDLASLSLTMKRCLVLFRPLLAIQPSLQSWPLLDGDPLVAPLIELGLTLRTFNQLRRQDIHCLAHLAGRTESSLLGRRGFGAGAFLEVQVILDRIGLDLPFSLADGFTLAPLPAPREQPIGWSLGIDQNAERQQAQEWVERAAALLTAPSSGEDSERVLRTLQALTLERYSGLRARLDEIHQLQDVFELVAEAAVQAAAMAPLSPLVGNAVRRQVMLRYALLLEQGQTSTSWLRGVHTKLRRSPRSLACLLLRLSGYSLQQIGDASPSRCSREAVRGQVQKAEKAFGFPAGDLVVACKKLLNGQQQQLRHAQLRQWIDDLGRLPFCTDEDVAEEPAEPMVRALRVEVLGLSLARRLGVYADLGLDVPGGEWDLHFRVLVNNEQRAGQGYWQDLEPLHQFLPRMATLLGEPGVMPYQEQLPPAVRGAVQRHGGQSAVAAALGLNYRGQLVGDHGRRFWSDLRLEGLLDQTVAFCKLPERSMPSRPQIRAFMQSGAVAEYFDKLPESAIAALTSASKLSWDEVAVRFCRC